MWDDDFIGVYHLSTVPTATVKDSTANANHLTSTGSMTTEDLVDSLPGKGIDFDGSNDGLYKTSPSRVPTAAFTLEAAGPGHAAGITTPAVQITDASAASDFMSIYLDGGYAKTNQDGAYVFSGTQAISNDVFTHIALSQVSASERNLFTNGGNKTGNTSSWTFPAGLDKICVGYLGDSSPYYFTGIVSEARFSDIARSDAWIKATYHTLADDLGSWSAVEAISAAPAGSWLSDWQSRQKITIDSADILSSGTDVVTAIVFDGTSGASLFSVLGENSDKIAITDHTGVRQCLVDVKNWDGSGTAAELHVTVPLIDADTDVVLYLYFDAGKADNAGFVGTTAATVSATTFTIGDLETFAGTGWLRGFTKRTKIAVAATNIDAALTHFPLTLFLSSSCGTGTQDMTAIFDEIGANSKKIAVTAADGKTQLPVEVDYWDSTGETAVLHVRVPSVDSAASTALYLYYSADVPDNDEFVGAVTEAPAMSVWDENFKAVYHMNQDPSATTMKDSSIAANHLSMAGTMLTADLVDSAPAKGIDFDGTDDVLYSTTVPVSAYPCTFELKGLCEADGPVIALADNSAADQMMALRVVTDTDLKASVLANNGATVTNAYGTTVLSGGTNYYLAGTFVSATERNVFTNGADKQTNTTSCAFATGLDQFSIGAIRDSSPAYYDGDVSEARVSDIERSDAWIKATYYALTDGLVTYTVDIETEDNWLGDWANRIQIRIDSSKIGEDLTDFPVAIHLGAAAGINGADMTPVFDELGANNLKLAVATAAGAQCYVEIDTWDETGETAVLHTKIPTVYAGRDTIFYLYYDSTKDDNSSYVGVTGSTPGKAVWDSNFLGVYHFSQDLSAGDLLDSTANGYDGTPANFEAGDTVAGQVGKHVTPDGSNEAVTGFAAGIVVTGTGARTTEVLAYPDQSGVNFPVYLGGSGTRDAWGLMYSPTEISAALSGCRRGITGAYGNTLRHVAISYPSGQTNSNQVALVVDGVAQSVSLTTGADGTINTATTYRRFFQLYTGDCAANVTDEIRISNVQRSTAWLKATYNTLFDTLAHFGATETLGGGWLRSWKYRRAFTIPSTNIDADLSDFPLALILNTAAGTGDDDISSIFDEIDENSKRIAVCAAHGDKQVPVEIETWDGSGESAVLHAKVPLITAADGAVVYVYYDDDRYDDGFIGETGEEIAQRVWDANFVAVWHMATDPSGASAFRDSTVNAFHGSMVGTMLTEDLVAGPTGKAIDFDGSNDEFTRADNALLNVDAAKNWTCEAVVNKDEGTVRACIFDKRYAGASTGWLLGIHEDDTPHFSLNDGSDSVESAGSTAMTVDGTTWYHVAGVFDRTGTNTAMVYLNGGIDCAPVSTAAIGNCTRAYPLHVGDQGYVGSSWGSFNGKMSELRLSDTVRSAAWLKATYNTLFDALAAWGAEGEEPAGGEPTTIDEPLGKAGRIDFTPHSPTDVLSMTEALSKAGRIDFTPHSLSESYTGNLLKMVDASGSRPKILTATGTKAKISAASGARPRLAAAEAYEYQERE